MRKIIDHYPDHDKVRLGISEGGVFRRPTVVTTVLGSCVAVTFYCRAQEIGATFHALLPAVPMKEKNNLELRHYKYVDTAIQHIIHTLQRRMGIKKKQIEAKVFGGAQGAFKGIITPGTNNIMTAYEILAAHDIQVVASDVGGEKGRNLIFVSNTGEVFIKNHREVLGQEEPCKKERIRPSSPVLIPEVSL